jgi:hypothetical protein
MVCRVSYSRLEVTMGGERVPNLVLRPRVGPVRVEDPEVEGATEQEGEMSLVTGEGGEMSLVM